MEDAQGALTLDLRWQAGAGWYAVRGQCAAGLTVVHGPGAPSLLRALAGRSVAWQGRVLLDGRPLRHGLAAVRYGPAIRPVAAVLEEALPLWHTPLGLVAAAVRRHGVPPGAARVRAAQALRWAGLGPHPLDPARRPLWLLGPALRRRAALARGLAIVPGLLLLERPCALLPAGEHAEVYARLRDLAAVWEMVVLVLAEDLHGLPRLELRPALARGSGRAVVGSP